MHLVAREGIALDVVSSNSIWVVDYLGSRVVAALVLKQVLDIVLGELSVQTQLHILDFLSDSWVIVVNGRLIDESLVEHTLEEQIEVGHESCVVSILVLHEDGVKSEIDLLLLWVRGLGSRELSQELKSGKEGNTPDRSDDSVLNSVD